MHFDRARAKSAHQFPKSLIASPFQPPHQSAPEYAGDDVNELKATTILRINKRQRFVKHLFQVPYHSALKWTSTSRVGQLRWPRCICPHEAPPEKSLVTFFDSDGGVFDTLGLDKAGCHQLPRGLIRRFRFAFSINNPSESPEFMMLLHCEMYARLVDNSEDQVGEHN